MKKKRGVVLVGAVTAATLINTVAPSLNINEILGIQNGALPIKIQPGTPTITKTGNVYNGGANGLYPQTSVANEGSSVTGGVNVSYDIPISIHSTNGKTFKIPEVKVVANPIIKYNGPSTPEKIKVAKEIQAQIETEIGKQGDINSSYSGKLIVTVKVPNVDWGMTIIPNISVESGNIKVPVTVPNLNTTNKYETNIKTQVTSISKDGTFGVSLHADPQQNNDFVNNHSNRKPSSVTFYMKTSGKNEVVTMNQAVAKKYGVVYNQSTDNYTITGAYASNGKDVQGLFKITPKNPSSFVSASVLLQPTSASYPNEEGSPVKGLLKTNCIGTWTTNYVDFPKIGMETSGSGIVPITVKNGTTINIESTTNGTCTTPKITSISTIGSGLSSEAVTKAGGSTDWNMYNATYLPKGKIISTYGSIGLASSVDARYYHIPKDYMSTFSDGTPEQKYNLLHEIMLNAIPGARYATGRDIIFNNGKTGVTDYNLIVSKLPKDNTGGYYAYTQYNGYADKGNPRDTLLAKTITFGFLPIGKTTPSVLFNGLNPKTDYVSTPSNGEASGFIAGDDNNINTTSINDGSKVFGYRDGYGTAVSARTGLGSHNSTAVTMNFKIGIKATIDEQVTQAQTSNWLSKEHVETFTYTPPNLGSGTSDCYGVYDKGTKLIITQSSSQFSITGPIKVGGVTIAHDKYRVVGNQIIIDAPVGTDASCPVILPIKYTNPSASTVGVTYKVEGAENNKAGISYLINGDKVPFSNISDNLAPEASADANITFTTQNGCLHYSNGVKADNTSTLTALVQNASGQSKKYMAIIQIPKAATPSLAGNQGQPSEGGLGAELQKIDATNTPIWVLPKSAINDIAVPGGLKTNEQMINDTNPYAVAKMQSAIESGKTGWVKYTPGMDLSNIASIAAMPTVAPHAVWKLNYKVKLTGVQNGTFQYTSSEFKYYDETDGVGSISNVVTLAPHGTDLTHEWSSTAIVKENGTTRDLTKEELAKEVTFTNSLTGKTQTESLGYLFSHGTDLDANYDNTPGTKDNHLQQEVDLVNTKDALAKVGFKLVETTVKIGNTGADTVDAAYFTNTGIAYNTQFTKILFVLEPVAPKVSDSVITQVKNANGTYSNVVVGGAGYENPTATTKGTKPQQGAEGTKITGDSGVVTPNIPYNYHINQVIVSVTNPDGSVTKTTEPATFKVPSKLGSANTRYTYQISKIQVKDTVKVLVNGKEVTVGQGGYVAPQLGKEGDVMNGSSDVTNPVIPTGYHTIGLTVTETTPDGKSVVKTYTSSVVNGVLSITIPETKIDGKIVPAKTVPLKDFNIPKMLGMTNVNYVYNILKDVKDTLVVRVKQANGSYKEVAVGQPGYVASQTGVEGIPEQGASGVKVPVIPEGYKVDSIEVNGKVVASTDAEIKAYVVEAKLGKVDTNYVYNISQNTGTVSTQVVVEDSEGTVLPKDPATQVKTVVQGKVKMSLVGTPIDGKTADTIMINGKSIDLNSSDIASKLRVAGYELIKTTIQKPLDKDASTITVTSITSNKVVLGNTEIVYTLKKLKPQGGVTVQVINLTDKNASIATHEVLRNNVGTTFGDSTAYVAPKGYSIVKKTLNSVVIKVGTSLANNKLTADTHSPFRDTLSNLPKDLTGDQHVVYTIVKNVKDTVTVLVDGKPMTSTIAALGTNLEPQAGAEGTPNIEGATPGNSDVKQPTIPKGYVVTGITINGKVLTPEEVKSYKTPSKLDATDTNIVYNITKIEPVTVKVITVNDKGVSTGVKQIATTTTNKVAVNSTKDTNVQNGISTDKIVGNDVQIVVPKGYHIYAPDGLTVNGTKIAPTVAKDGTKTWMVPVDSVIGKNGTAIVYKIEKDAPKTYVTTVTVTDKDGNPIPNMNNKKITTVAGGNVDGGTSDDGTGIIIPKGYKLVPDTTTTDGTKTPPKTITTTVDGKIVTSIEVPAITKIEKNHAVHYVLEKVGNVTVAVVIEKDGKLVPFAEGSYQGKDFTYKGTEHIVEPDTALGGDITGTSIVLPKGYGLVKTTVQIPTAKVASNVADVVTAKDGSTSSKTLDGTDLLQGTTKVVYEIKKLTGTVITTVVGPNGKTFVTNPPKKGNGNDGDVVIPPTTSITPPKGYHVTTVTVDGGTPIKPTLNPDGSYSVPPMHYNGGGVEHPQTVVYHVVPDVGSVDVTVRNEVGDTIVIPTVKTVTDADIINTTTDANTKLTGYGLTKAMKDTLTKDGYELVPVKTTIQVNDGKATDVTQEALSKDDLVKGITHIVYIVKKTPGTVSVSVVYPNGEGKLIPYVANGYKGAEHIVDTDKIGNPIKDYGVTPPVGYHIVKTTIQVPTSTTAVDVTGTNPLNTTKIVKGNTKIVYVLAKNKGTLNVTVRVKESDGTYKVINPTKVVQDSDIGTAIGTAANYDKQIIPAGYHLVETTVNSKVEGTSTSPATGITGTIGETPTSVVYTIEKDKGSVAVTVNIVNSKDHKVVVSTPVKDAKVITDADSGTTIGTKANLGNIPNVPAGYHIVSASITQPDGSKITLGKDSKTVTGLVPNGTAHITYNIAKDQGSVDVTVNIVDSKDHTKIISTPVTNHTVMSNADLGISIEGANYSNIKSLVPAGYHLVSASSNGVATDVKLGEGSNIGTVTGKVGNGVEHIIYNVVKNITNNVDYTIITNDKTPVVLVPVTSVKKGVTPGTTVTTQTITIPKGYEMIPQTPITGNTGTPTYTSKVIDGNTVVTITTPTSGNVSIVKDTHLKIVVKKIPKYTTTVTYVTDGGKTVVVPKTEVGTAVVGGSTVGIDVKVPKGYHIDTTVHPTDNGETIPGVTPEDGKTFNVTTGTATKGHNNDVIIHLVKNVYHTVVTVTMKDASKLPEGVIIPKQVDSNAGTDVSADSTAVVIPKGYHIVTVTSKVGDAEPTSTTSTNSIDKMTGSTTAKTATIVDIEANHAIHYVIEKDAPKIGKVDVTVQIVDADGKVISTPVATHVVETGNVDTKITGANYDDVKGIPAGYHLVKTTVNGKEVGTSKAPAKVIVGKVTESTTHVVYQIVQNTYHTTVTVTTTSGGSVPGVTIPPVVTTTDGGTVTGTSTGVVIPKGYKIVKVTSGTSTTNGTPVTPITSTTTDGGTNAHTPDITKVHSDHHIHYVVEKTGTVSVEVLVKDAKTGKTSIFNDSAIKGANHIVDTDVIGAIATGTGITIPTGYHLVATTVNKIDTPVAEIPNVKVPDGNTDIVYTIEKNTPPAPKTGVVTVTVVGTNGHVYVTKHDVTKKGGSVVGGDVPPAGSTTITPPTGTTVTTVTVGGTPVTPVHNPDGSYSIPPLKVKEGHQDIIWTVKSEVGSVDVTVKNEAGDTIIPVAKVVTDANIIDAAGKTVKISNYGLTAGDIATLKKEGYELVPSKTTVQTPSDKIAVNTTQAALSSIDLTKGTTHIIYIVKKIPKYTTTVTYVTDGGKVVVVPKTEVGTAVVGGSTVGIDVKVPKGYHIDTTVHPTNNGKTIPGVTPKDGKSFNVTTGTVTAGHNNDIVITIVKDAPKVGKVEVTVRIKNANGTYTETTETNKVVQTANVDTVISGANYSSVDPTITKGYHLVETTVNNISKGTEATVTGKVTEATTHVVYTIEKNAPKIYTTTVTVTTTNGGSVPGVTIPPVVTTIDGGTVTGTSTGVVIPKGYKIVKVTSGTSTTNGTPVTPITSTTTDGGTNAHTPDITKVHSDHHIHYVVEKTGTVSVEVLVKDAKTGKTSIFNDSAIKGANHIVDTDVIGAIATGTGITIPTGYHLVATTVNKIDTPVAEIPNVKVPDGNTDIVYTIEKNTPPAPKTGVVTVTVVGTNGHVYVTKHDVTKKGGSVVGGDVPPAGSTTITPPTGTTVTTVTVGGTPVTPVHNPDGSYSIPPLKVKEGHQDIIWTVKSEVGSVDVTVKNEAGDTIIPVAKVVTDANIIDAAGKTVKISNYGLTAGDIATLKKEGYELVPSKTTVQTPSDKIAVDTTQAALSSIDLTKGTTHIIYVVKKTPKPPVIEKGTVHVKIITEGGTIITANHLVDTDVVGAKIKGAGYIPVPGYHLVKTEGNPDGNVVKGDTQIIYVVTKNIVPPIPVVKKGSVTVEVITTSGTIIIKEHNVLTDVKVGTDFGHNTDISIPDGYHIKEVTLGGNKVSEDSLGTNTITEGTQHVVYVIEKNPIPKPPVVVKGTVTVQVITTDRTVIVKPHLVDTDIVGNKITGAGFTKIPGYTYVKVEGNPDGNVVKGNTEITYVVSKDPKPVPPTPVVKKGSVTVEIITANGTILTKTHDVLKDVDAGTAFAHNTDLTLPKGYHYVSSTLNGKSISEDSISGHSIEGDKTQSVVYVVAKDVEPKPPTPVVVRGTVHVRVITEGGTIITANHLVDTDIVGNKITGAGFTKIPGYHLVKTEGNPDGKVVKGDTQITYVIKKDVPPTPVVETGSVTVEIITDNGTVITKTHSVMTNVPVKTAFGTSTNVTIPNGYHLVKITKNGDDVTAKGLETSTVVKGNTSVVYVVTKNETPKPPTPVKHYGNVTVEVITADGTVMVKTHTVDTDIVGNDIKNTSIEIPAGYHLTKTSIDNKEVKVTNGVTGKISNGTTSIVYTITKNIVPPTPVKPDVKPTPKPVPPTPVKPTVETGIVTVKIITNTGVVIATEHTVQTSEVGTKVENPKVNIPSGYHLIETTVDGNKVTDGIQGNITKTPTKIVYIIAKNVVVPDIKPIPNVVTPEVSPTPVVIVTNPKAKATITQLPDTGINYSGMEKEAGAIGLLSLLGLSALFFKKKK